MLSLYEMVENFDHSTPSLIDMHFNELDLKRIAKATVDFMAEHRPPPYVRAQLDFECRIEGPSVELLEVRPQSNQLSEITERPFAKATYVRSQSRWKVYWMRGNLKWSPYETAEARSIDQFFKLVGNDKLGCFFG